MERGKKAEKILFLTAKNIGVVVFLQEGKKNKVYFKIKKSFGLLAKAKDHRG